jgi:predicted SprT family Zn-dependent metalloprotease
VPRGACLKRNTGVRALPLLQGEAVAQAIKKHQVDERSLWCHRDLVRELHLWVERLDKDFNLGVPTPVIGADHLRISVLGSYRVGPSDIGARTTITLNERWLPYRSFAEILITLAHEVCHAHEEWRLGRGKGGWYHTAAWRKKLAEVGIIADSRGRTVRVESRFHQYLERYGISEVRTPTVSAHEAPAKRRQTTKWVCGCWEEKPARATRLHARCLDCGRVYRRADS